MFKRISKLSSIILLLLLIPALNSCGNYLVIDSRGSSSVQPFISNLGNLYISNEPERNVEISVQAGGSSIGISSIANNQTTMGNASKSPRSTVTKDSNLETKWRTNELKTITLAKDAIGILLLPPSNTENSWTVNENNIISLYKAFAGYESIPLKEFYAGNQSEISNDITITPFARSGGAASSGTAEAFFKDSNFNTDGLDEKSTNALSNGTYGPNVIDTNESNNEAYTKFKTTANKPGSMIYLSLGFILNNLNEIQKDGFVLLKYNDVEATIKNVENKSYNWIRPFNTIISLKENTKLIEVKKFIEWILFTEILHPKELESVNQLYLSQGLIRLSDDEIKQMFLLDQTTNDLPLSDLVQNHIDLFWKNDYSFEPVRFGVE